MMADRRATNIRGKNHYADFKKGLRLTHKQAILAKCYECMGAYEDGKQDCCGGGCPLYQFYPYKAKKGVREVEN